MSDRYDLFDFIMPILIRASIFGILACFAQSIVYGLLMTIQCHWLYSCLYRDKLRKKFGLAEEPCCDCCVNFCCEPCALCQEHAELKSRGFDPSKGN